MVGPGWGPAHALPLDGVYHGPIRLPIPINTVYVGFGNQEIFLRPSPWCNPFVFFTEDEQEANWIFAQFGRSRADKVQWLSPILGKQLACDCGQSKCHASVLDELMCELVTSGAMTNEGWEFSAAQSGKTSIPDGSVAPSWNASSTSSVYNKTQSAWPESWTVLRIEMRSFQCRCFWKYASRRFSIVTIFQTGRLGRGVIAGYQSQSRFELAKPFVFRCGCGFTSGRESSTTEFASLRYCNPGQIDAIATASERVLDLDTIAIHRNFCLGSGWCSVSPSRRSSNGEINIFGWSAPGVRITRLCPIIVQF